MSFSAFCVAESSVGIQTLGLLNPKFPVNDAYEVLKDARNPSFAFVYKSFGSRKENLWRLIELLGNRPDYPSSITTVFVYADCGPCRPPRRPKGLFPLILKDLTIQRLNRLLERRDAYLLARLNKDLEEIRSYLRRMPGVHYVFYPGLEDNLTKGAHAVFRDLALQVFRERDDVTLGRNPLNPHKASYPIEVHSYSLSTLRQLKKGDILAGDGFILCYPGEKGCKGLSLNTARTLVREARRRGVHLLFWGP